MSSFIIIVLFSGIFIKCIYEERMEIDSTYRNIDNLCRSVDEQTTRTFEEADTLSIHIKSLLDRHEIVDFASFIRIYPRVMDVIEQFAIADENGLLVSSNIPGFKNVDISDREHFKVHIARDTDELFISKPVLGKVSGKWSIQLSRRLNKDDGTFGGVVVVSIDPYYFSRFYQDLDIGHHGSVILVGLDGVVRARSNMDDSMVGQDLRESKLFSMINDAIPAAHFEAAGLLSNEHMFYSYRVVKGFPFAVLIGVSKGEALTGFYTRRNIYFTFASVLSVIVLMFSYRMAKLLRERNDMNVGLENIVAKRTFDLNETNKMLIEEVTQRKNIQSDLILMKDKAEAANQAKSEFLANMSHEIRTPLNGVLGMLQILLVTCQDDKQREYIQTAIASSRQLTDLLSDILDLSRIEAGKLIIRKEAFDARELGRSVREIFTHFAEQKGLRLNIKIDDRIPTRLIGDDARLRQIVLNLVGNALKFTRQGSITLTVSLISPPGEIPAKIILNVIDTGIGIPEDRLEAIFEPFTQADGSSVRAYQGVGLGLTIVRRLVTLMGGEIAMTSLVGQGTEVRVTLPFGVAPEAPPDDPPKTMGRPHLAAGHPRPEFNKHRLLLVEDEAINQLSMKILLTSEGYDVALAENGRQALDMLAEGDFDLILMDGQMPVMDGHEAAQIIRTSSEFGAKAHIPMIALTAHAMDGDREKFLSAGMDDYIAKPVNLETLKEAIRRVMNKRSIQ
jgi:signal transduction histidine kinase/CheY-like chemotaxis protein